MCSFLTDSVTLGAAETWACGDRGQGPRGYDSVCRAPASPAQRKPWVLRHKPGVVVHTCGLRRQEDKEAKVVLSCRKTKQKQMLANMQEARQNQLLSSCPFFAVILLLSWVCHLSCPLWSSLADRRAQAESPLPP